MSVKFYLDVNGWPWYQASSSVQVTVQVYPNLI